MLNNISIIKEKKPGEVRVILTPDQTRLFKENGFNMLVEKDAGLGLGYTNSEYKKNGCKIVSTEEGWNNSKLIFKYKPPTTEEFRYLNQDKIICGVFHAEGDPILTNNLLKSKCTVYSYEFFKTPEGIYPLSVASSEIAGKVAVIYAAYHLQRHLGGNGVLLAPVVNLKPPKVLVIGYGNSGGSAARLAAAMGAQVTVLGTNKENLRAFQATMPQNTICLINSKSTLRREIMDADIVIGAILISTYDTPAMIDDNMVKSMKKGSIIVDVTAGYGAGYISSFDKNSSFEYPVYERYGILHCKIDVLPLAYPNTTVQAMSQHLSPYLLNLAKTVFNKNFTDLTSENGKIIDNGKINNYELERHMNYYQNEPK